MFQHHEFDVAIAIDSYGCPAESFHANSLTAEPAQHPPGI